MLVWMQWCARRSVSRRAAYIFLILVLMWTMMTVNILLYVPTNKDVRASNLMRGDILRISGDYVQALARENGDVVDGPYISHSTGYDMKKTMAVLLDNMLSRLSRLELKLGVNNSKRAAVANASHARSQNLQPIYLKDVLRGKTEECRLTPEERKLYPACQDKIDWMKTMWKSDECYSTFGVDGTMCSFLRYLSEVESWCPFSSWRRRDVKPLFTAKNASTRTDLDGLLRLLADPNDRHAYSFMRLRVSRMWPTWVAAVKSLVNSRGLTGRLEKRVLIHLGLLTNQIGWKFAENQFSGGPLGEIVQWTDLIACLYILGHNITITSEVEHIRQMLRKLPSAKSPCQNLNGLPVDLFYTDIGGLRQFKKYLSSGYAKFKCLLRIVDSFGTEPAFNHPQYAKRKHLVSPWGGNLLNPQQFFTMFPHTPDNSFMGFVVEHHSKGENSSQVRRDQALVYGKRDAFWKDKDKYLGVIKELLEVHATVGKEKTTLEHVPSFVQNHGFLSGSQLHDLLRQSKIFIGLGFPYEGPAPLEAIANGAVFLNPKFSPPHHRGNVGFLKGKPTSRTISSQHPYAESFIGEPYVYTIDMDKPELVQRTIQHILKTSKFQSYLPHEFSEAGMLQRMSSYIQHQNFCPPQQRVTTPRWPPPWSVRALLAPVDTDCGTFCHSRELVCEPTYFPDLNNALEFSRVSVFCDHTTYTPEIHAPGVNVSNSTCLLQSDSLLFSCAGKAPMLRRICPCRTYARGQVALCDGCA